MSLTKSTFTQQLHHEMGLNKRDARELVELFFEDMKQALAQGEPIRLSGFGTFDLRDKGHRQGRNPKTGENVPITARRVVKFKAGKTLKQKVGHTLDQRDPASHQKPHGDLL
jgi:integration host factor subunit alpha